MAVLPNNGLVPTDFCTKVLAVVVTRGPDHCKATVKSLTNQTLKPDIHVEVGYPIPRMQTCKLVCVYANKALAQHNLSEYDYLLKSDEDVVYPSNFLEANTQLGYDLIGGGTCLLAKTEPFLKLMNGRFIPNNFHAGLIQDVFEANGLSVSHQYPDQAVQPIVARKEYLHPARSFWSGFDQYSFRHNKFKYFEWMFLGSLTQNPFLLFTLLGYLYAGLKRRQRFVI